MEDAAIRDGFERLRPGWLVGINATRQFSVLYGTTLNVGRVMTPTLALLVQREADIRAFESKPFFVPEILCGQRGAAVGFTASGEKLRDRAGAEAVRPACDGQTVTVRSVEKQKKTAQSAPLPRTDRQKQLKLSGRGNSAARSVPTN